jgi:hypothetical protein
MFQKSLWDAKLFMIERARAVVLQQYCNKLTLRGACSGDCKTCGAQIQLALNWMTEKNIPKLSYGIFGKLMKNAFAKRLEEMIKHPQFKPEASPLGEATERDALDIFMETLS